MSLLELQRHFITAIFNRDQRDAAALLVKSHGKLDAAQRVGIYRNSVHGILLQYLESLYPVCQQLLGAEFFAAASDRYVDQQPPTRPFLAEYGAGFVDFLAAHPVLQQMQWISDVARLEWARHQAWNAVNQPAADFSQLATLDTAQQVRLRLELTASAQLLASAYAIHQVWLAHQPEDAPEKVALEQLVLHQNQHVLVWRAGRQLHQVVLDETAAAFLGAIQQANTLPELAARFQGQFPALLMVAVQRGWVVSFTIH